MTDVTADRAADPTELPPVQDYLARLREAGRLLPPDRLEEVLDDVRDHVRHAVADEVAGGADATVAARNALDRLGPPADIARAAAEQSGVPSLEAASGPSEPSGPGAMVRYGEPVALFLLLFGGFLLFVGWFVGAILLWLAPSWRLREKLLGTLVWPGGYLGVLAIGGVVTYTESCVSTGTSVDDGPTTVCTGGAPYPGWVAVLIGISIVAAPAVMAALLWRRRQQVLAATSSS